MSAFPLPSIIVRAVAGATRPVRARLVPRYEPGIGAQLRSFEAALQRWLVAHSVAFLRVSLGAVLFAFGLLKFFPGVSPAQNLVEATTHLLFLGLVPGPVALVFVATLETVVGLWLLSGRAQRGAVRLLGVQLIGVLSPLVLLPGRLFAGPHDAPTLEGQYVLKDVILVGAALVLAATLAGGGPREAPAGDRAR
jgi:uncharacterized membrane protein YkgB